MRVCTFYVIDRHVYVVCLHVSVRLCVSKLTDFIVWCGQYHKTRNLDEFGKSGSSSQTLTFQSKVIKHNKRLQII